MLLFKQTSKTPKSKWKFEDTSFYRFLDKIAQSTSLGPNAQEKDQKVVMNTLLNEYYMNKGKHP